ncbi:uncharacterized protein LOC121775258 isoform X1 [Salvia splendens]|uniref:uncharacterized protein LOC121775258 isoform X1 n=1 Tax=Salvia splendens TaxID=180675 RepID=UPI001C275F8E|nr:uncharacterized protein LOC121775258 isoform X1 [Salvia splendens]
MGRKNVEVEGATSSSIECCMCGDHGVSSELFLCSACGFRSQHKYCSNLYPGAESYDICNWCINRKGEETTKSSQNSSHKTDHRDVKMKKGKIDINLKNRRAIGNGSKRENKTAVAAPPPLAGRKRVTSDRGGVCGERRIIKPVFRNKVRRYKLLDEVSS